MNLLARLRSTLTRDWLKTPPHDAARSLNLVRIATALILLAHPGWALLHPAYRGELSLYLASRGLPMAMGLVWVGLLVQAGCALALLANRFVVPACLGQGLLLALTMGFVQAPRWYVVGGGAEDGHPGVEFSALLLACLVGVLWAQRGAEASDEDRARSARQGLDVVRVATALILVTHPLHGLADPSGLHQFGVAMGALGFPFGVQLVWTTMFVQVGGALGLATRRLVVPSALALAFVNVLGIFIAHRQAWFVVGPGEGGMEYSLLLIACYAASLWAHWPAPAEARVLGELTA